MTNVTSELQASSTVTSEQEDGEITFSGKRIAFNNADSYHGQYLVEILTTLLSQSISPGLSRGSEFYEYNQEDEYDMVATVKDLESKDKIQYIKIVSKDVFFDYLLKSGYILLDITGDSESLEIADQLLDVLNDILSKEFFDAEITGQQRHIILISTVMTWALTKPLDPDTPDMPFLETDYRKRRAHPNFEKHFKIENEVINLGKKYPGKINTVVLSSGFTYGGKEDSFHYLFQMAWENVKILPILGSGQNLLPIINVIDLANVVLSIILRFPRIPYIFVIEPHRITQGDIVTALSKNLGSGLFKCIPKEDGFLINQIKQKNYDMITFNQIIDPLYVLEFMEVDWSMFWHLETFNEKMPQLINQFKEENNFNAYRIVINGPPGVGKTTIAKQIAKNYGLIYISPDTIVKERFHDLVWRLEEYEMLQQVEECADDYDDYYEIKNNAGDWEECAIEARSDLELLKVGRFDDDDIVNLIKRRISSNDCLNQGWVLDGFPENRSQGLALFENRTEREDSDDEEKRDTSESLLAEANAKKYLPTTVVSLNANNRFLERKILNLPECELRDTKLDELTFVKRLTEYRTNNSSGHSPISYFADLGCEPFNVNIDDPNVTLDLAYIQITFQVGKPCKSESLPARIEAIEKQEREQAEEKAKRKAEMTESLEKKLKQEKEEKFEYWGEVMAVMREEEEEILASQSEGMRNYLIKFILPVMVPGLLEVTKQKPEDPIDFLAHYLFKNNPDGKMLEGGFDLQREIKLNRILILDEDLLKSNIVIPDKSAATDSSSSIISLPSTRILHSQM